MGHETPNFTGLPERCVKRQAQSRASHTHGFRHESCDALQEMGHIDCGRGGRDVERYWVSNNVLLNLSDQLGEALPSDKFTPMVKAADAQATIAALEQRIQELQDKVGECAKVPVTFDPYW